MRIGLDKYNPRLNTDNQIVNKHSLSLTTESPSLDKVYIKFRQSVLDKDYIKFGQSLSNAHARVFRHRAFPWVLYAEVFLARVVLVMYQQKYNGLIFDTFLVAN